MRTLLFYFGILTFVLMIVVVIGNITGKVWITHNEYFFVVSVFVVSVLLYDKKKTG